jgi:hypothetical protein
MSHPVDDYPDDYDFDGDDDDEPDEWEEAMQECGRGQGYEGCTQAGTEYCEFECPFRDEELDEDDEDDLSYW